MSERNRAVVELEFQDGTVLRNFERFSLRDNFTDPLGDFSFTLRPTAASLSHYSAITERGELVKVYINGAKQATMTIVKRSRTLDRDGQTIELSCKTPLCVPYKGSVDPTIAKHFPASALATEVVLAALAPYGFDTVMTNAAANVNTLTGKAVGGATNDVVVTEMKVKEAEAQENEKAYAFCARLVGRLGVAIRCTANGEILLVAPNFDQAAAYSLVQAAGERWDGDVMLDGITLEEDNDPVYSEVIVRGDTPDGGGQKSTGRPLARVIYDNSYTPSDAFLKDTPTTTIPAHTGTYTSTSQRYKPLIVTDKLSRDAKLAVSRAKRIHGRTSENAWVLTCEVDGLVSNTGRVWTVNTVVDVVCREFNISEPLWVLETTKTGDRQSGQRTKLKLIPLGSLVLGDVPGGS